MSDDQDYEFARIVYQILIVEKTHRLGEIADAIGMNYATLHARLNRRAHFRPAEMRALFRVIADARPISYLLGGSRFTVAERPVRNDASASVLEWTHRALFHVVDALRQAKEALSDNQIDHRERLSLLEEIRKAEIALASLKASVEAGTT